MPHFAASESDQVAPGAVADKADKASATREAASAGLDLLELEEDPDHRAPLKDTARSSTNQDAREQCRSDFFSLLMESKMAGFSYGLTRSAELFYRLPLKFDVAQMQVEADLLESMYGFDYREDVNNYFLLLVTKKGELEEGRQGPFAPVPDRLSLTPYLRRVVDSLGIVLGRSRFMMLKAGERVKSHRDNVQFRPDKLTVASAYNHGYWARRFRVHVPIRSHKAVLFGSADKTIHMEPGYAYLFDNGNKHMVVNNSPIDRVHFIMDTVGSARMFELMRQADVFDRSGKWQKGSEVVEVPYDPVTDADVELFYEDWKDPKAFSYMPAEHILEFVERNVMNRILDGNLSQRIAQLMEDFVGDYAESCSRAFKPDHGKCNEAIFKLLSAATDLTRCGASGPVRFTRSSLEVVDVLEVLMRILFLPCREVGQGNAEGEVESAAAEALTRNELVLPIPGHPFRTPQCVRKSDN